MTRPSAAVARAGIKKGRFIRMHRITRIIRIAPCGGMTHSPESASLCYFVEEVRVAAEASPSGSSQKIPALVLRTVMPREAIPNNQPQSGASVLNLPFLMPAPAALT